MEETFLPFCSWETLLFCLLTDFLASEEVNKMLKSKNQRWNIEVVLTSCFFFTNLLSTIWDFNSCSKTASKKIIYKFFKTPTEMGKTFPLNHLDNFCVCSSSWLLGVRPQPPHQWGQEPAPSHRWWDPTDSSSRRSSSHRAGGCGAMRLGLHHPLPTQDPMSLKAHPTPPGKAPSGWAWQDSGLGERLNGCFWDRLSALLNNTRITKQAFDYFFFYSAGGHLSARSLPGTLLSWSFSARETFGEGGEKEIENAKGKLDQTTLTLWKPKIHACMSKLARCKLKSQM